MTSARRLALAGVGVAVLLVGLLAIVAVGGGSVTAGDQLAVIDPTPHEVEAEPGETFEVDVVMRSEGGHGGEGVASFELVGQYHPDYLEIVAIESGDWLEQGDETEITEEQVIAHEAGTAILEQRRDPVADGAKGQDRVATVTVRVLENAPAHETTLSFGDSGVYLERKFPLAIHHREVTVSVDGGGEPHEPFDHPDPSDRESLESMTADENETDGGDDTDEGRVDGTSGSESDADAGTEADDADGAVTDESDDPISGFTAVAGAGVLLATLVALAGIARLGGRDARGPSKR
ncbi:cohesin domain-containing protein [Natronosalvus vescus]|uniref:cohesin domain-containing protein n=1 Tax=Natronosalvus vescus TaxID=2953881 RepID=UPI0020915E99|nr:cohesin domain-containing protein [Natronosalvus vescus]